MKTEDAETKYIKSSTALEITREYDVNITHVTLLQWVARNALGIQPNGKHGHWLINEKKLRRFLDGADEELIKQETGNASTTSSSS